MSTDNEQPYKQPPRPKRFRIVCRRNGQTADVAAPTAEAAIARMRAGMRTLSADPRDAVTSWDRYAKDDDVFHVTPLLSWTDFCDWVTRATTTRIPRRVVGEWRGGDGDGELVLTFDDGSRAHMETHIETDPGYSEVTPGGDFVGSTAIWIEETP